MQGVGELVISESWCVQEVGEYGELESEKLVSAKSSRMRGVGECGECGELASAVWGAGGRS